MSEIETQALEELGELLGQDWHEVQIEGAMIECYFRRTSGDGEREGAYLVAGRDVLDAYGIGDQVVFEGITYEVEAVQPDGNVSTRFLLSEPPPP